MTPLVKRAFGLQMFVVLVGSCGYVAVPTAGSWLNAVSVTWVFIHAAVLGAVILNWAFELDLF